MSTIGVVVLTHNRMRDLAATLARMCALAEAPTAGGRRQRVR